MFTIAIFGHANFANCLQHCFANIYHRLPKHWFTRPFVRENVADSHCLFKYQILPGHCFLQISVDFQLLSKRELWQIFDNKTMVVRPLFQVVHAVSFFDRHTYLWLNDGFFLTKNAYLLPIQRHLLDDLTLTDFSVVQLERFFVHDKLDNMGRQTKIIVICKLRVVKHASELISAGSGYPVELSNVGDPLSRNDFVPQTQQYIGSDAAATGLENFNEVANDAHQNECSPFLNSKISVGEIERIFNQTSICFIPRLLLTNIVKIIPPRAIVTMNDTRNEIPFVWLTSDTRQQIVSGEITSDCVVDLLDFRFMDKSQCESWTNDASCPDKLIVVRRLDVLAHGINDYLLENFPSLQRVHQHNVSLPLVAPPNLQRNETFQRLQQLVVGTTVSVKIRVLSKQLSRYVNNDKISMCLALRLFDSSGQVEAVCFDNEAERLEKLIEADTVYIIRKGTVLMKPSQYGFGRKQLQIKLG